MIISSNNLQEIRNQIISLKKSNKEEKIAVKGGDEEFNRKVLEIKGVDILLSPELHESNDKLKQRDSGLNEYLCKLAKKNNVSIGIEVEKIKILDKKEKAKVLARIMQNIKLCKRTKTKIIFFPENKYKKQDLIGFITTFKGSTNQIMS